MDSFRGFTIVKSLAEVLRNYVVDTATHSDVEPFLFLEQLHLAPQIDLFGESLDFFVRASFVGGDTFEAGLFDDRVELFEVELDHDGWRLGNVCERIGKS